MANSRLIWGIAIISLGFILSLIPLFIGWAGFFSWIYSIPILIIGLLILLNNKEDIIEGRKDEIERRSIKDER